jgi:tRNA(Arg) A34 adenosine deaminase TadA
MVSASFAGHGPIMEHTLTIRVPAFVSAVVAAHGPFDSDEARMRLAIALARANVEHDAGPFGAAVFSGDRLIAAGVNRVLAEGLSIAHAEIVALMHAQSLLRHQPPAQPLTLVTSTEPCCQCFGAIIWSSIERLVCGAISADAEAIGFDEGPKPVDWPQELLRRGIRVTEQVCRDEARLVLAEYARRGGPIYGMRHPTLPGKRS